MPPLICEHPAAIANEYPCVNNQLLYLESRRLLRKHQNLAENLEQLEEDVRTAIMAAYKNPTAPWPPADILSRIAEGQRASPKASNPPYPHTEGSVVTHRAKMSTLPPLQHRTTTAAWTMPNEVQNYLDTLHNTLNNKRDQDVMCSIASPSVAHSFLTNRPSSAPLNRLPLVSSPILGTRPQSSPSIGSTSKTLFDSDSSPPQVLDLRSPTVDKSSPKAPTPVKSSQYSLPAYIIDMTIPDPAFLPQPADMMDGDFKGTLIRLNQVEIRGLMRKQRSGAEAIERQEREDRKLIISAAVKSLYDLTSFTRKLLEIEEAPKKAAAPVAPPPKTLLEMAQVSNKVDCRGMIIKRSDLMQLFMALTNNITLKELDLSDQKIQDYHVDILCEALVHNSSLNILSLESNQITDVGASTLVECLCVNKSLQVLKLNKNNISDSILANIRDLLIPRGVQS